MANTINNKFNTDNSAIVEDEVPFELPNNWCWVKLPKISVIKTGKKNANHAKDNGIYRFYTCSSKYSFCDTYSFQGESIIVPGNGDVGLVFYYDGFFEAYQRTYVINNIIGNSKYLYYYFAYNWRKFNNNKQFGTAIPYVRITNFDNFYIPFAPINEQERIVEKLDRLFEKLDKAKDLIQQSLDMFEDRKNAILHKAFSGELTAEWRKNNNKCFLLTKKLFGEIAYIKSNLVEPIKYLDMPHIAPDNIEKYTGKLLGFKTIREDNVFSPKHRFFKGQILYSKIRPNLNKLVIADCDGLCSADMYPIEAKENTKYLFYYMLSSEFLQQSASAGSRSVLPKINQNELNNLYVKMTSIEEQEEIVRILDSIFEKEDKTKELLDMIDKIDEMKKTILAKAFRGELNTNNPEDEPAEELVNRILENK